MNARVCNKSFQNAVESTVDISNGFKNGLQALGANSELVIPNKTRYLEGSVDIDLCTKYIYPKESRWDYALAYSGEVYFIEVHPAISSEVKNVIDKLLWLKSWLKTKAPEIEKLRKKDGDCYFWIASKNFSIPKSSKQYRLASSCGIKPIKKAGANVCSFGKADV